MSNAGTLHGDACSDPQRQPGSQVNRTRVTVSPTLQSVFGGAVVNLPFLITFLRVLHAEWEHLSSGRRCRASRRRSKRYKRSFLPTPIWVDAFICVCVCVVPLPVFAASFTSCSLD